MTTSSLRFALIGCAATIAPTHLRALQRIPDATIVGMCDINSEAGAARAAQVGSPFFTDYRTMLAETQPDVTVIMTPHPLHPSHTLDALAVGTHVLVEKPMAVEVADADMMIAAAEKAQRILAVNFQQRFRASVEKARELIEGGAVGPLLRVLSIEPWFRPAIYFRQSTWRGRWDGEGGGVLMNQAPHSLDLLCYLAGMPVKVWGWTRTRHHAIETEDTAQAMLEFANGAPGYLAFSTYEFGVERRLEIVGENGILELVGKRVTLQRLSPSLPEYTATSQEMFGSPNRVTEVFDFSDDRGTHYHLYMDLIAAIREGRQPRANGKEGLMSLELANAITLSSYGGAAVTLPVDRAAYRALLSDLRAKAAAQG